MSQAPVLMRAPREPPLHKEQSGTEATAPHPRTPTSDACERVGKKEEREGKVFVLHALSFRNNRNEISPVDSISLMLVESQDNSSNVI